MKRLVAALAISIGLASAALAQVVNDPTPNAPAGAYNSSVPTCTAGKFCYTQVDVNGQSKISVADGADATLGAKADAAWTSGSGSVIAILKNIASGITSAIAAGTNYIGQVGLNAVATGGWTPKWFVAANTDNATNLKASAGIVHAIQVFGVGSAPAYLKFYDKATSPTCGSDTIVKQIMIPAAATAANGAGAVATVLDAQFSTGISYCVVTGITAADDTAPAASTFVVNIDWK